jgi:hypothetical protein
MRPVLLWYVALCLVVCASVQSSQSAISKTVSDPSGAVVSTAPIDIKISDKAIVCSGATVRYTCHLVKGES